MRSTNRLALAVAAALAIGGCAGSSLYVPTAHVEAVLPHRALPAAAYRVPTVDPRGEVRLAAPALKRIARGKRRLYTRFVVVNRSDRPWRLAAARQELVLPSGRRVAGRISPVAARTSEQLVVPPHGQGSIDLAFDVDGRLPKSFQLAWTVDTDRQPVSRRTTFRRAGVEPTFASGPPYIQGYYWSPIWLAPPYYGAFGFPPVTVRPPTLTRVAGRRVRIVPARAPIQVPPVVQRVPQQ
jgi:hypothetical protein